MTPREEELRQIIFHAERELEVLLKEDTELEEAKKKFPVGSWFTSDGFDRQAHTVKAVERRYLNIITLVTYYGPHHFPAVNCIPLSIPIWRCFDSDKPERSGYYYLRSKDRQYRKLAEYHPAHNWYGLGKATDYEWLDEGGAE